MAAIGAKRILVYGVCGSGKTTFAGKVSEHTGIPWHSVDDLAWEPGWKMTTEEFQAGKIAEICQAEAWILDTAYGKWIEIPLSKVDLILALDYPRWFSFLRLFKRSISRAIDKKPICNGNQESWRLMFSRDSILVWHFKSFKRKRERIREWAKSGNGPKVIVFRSARQAEDWLSRLSAVLPRD